MISKEYQERLFAGLTPQQVERLNEAHEAVAKELWKTIERLDPAGQILLMARLHEQLETSIGGIVEAE